MTEMEPAADKAYREFIKQAVAKMHLMCSESPPFDDRLFALVDEVWNKMSERGDNTKAIQREQH